MAEGVHVAGRTAATPGKSDPVGWRGGGFKYLRALIASLKLCCMSFHEIAVRLTYRLPCQVRLRTLLCFVLIRRKCPSR